MIYLVIVTLGLIAWILMPLFCLENWDAIGAIGTILIPVVLTTWSIYSEKQKEKREDNRRKIEKEEHTRKEHISFIQNYIDKNITFISTSKIKDLKANDYENILTDIVSPLLALKNLIVGNNYYYFQDYLDEVIIFIMEAINVNNSIKQAFYYVNIRAAIMNISIYMMFDEKFYKQTWEKDILLFREETYKAIKEKEEKRIY